MCFVWRMVIGGYLVKVSKESTLLAFYDQTYPSASLDLQRNLLSDRLAGSYQRCLRIELDG